MEGTGRQHGRERGKVLTMARTQLTDGPHQGRTASKMKQPHANKKLRKKCSDAVFKASTARGRAGSSGSTGDGNGEEARHYPKREAAFRNSAWAVEVGPCFDTEDRAYELLSNQTPQQQEHAREQRHVNSRRVSDESANRGSSSKFAGHGPSYYRGDRGRSLAQMTLQHNNNNGNHAQPTQSMHGSRMLSHSHAVCPWGEDGDSASDMDYGDYGGSDDYSIDSRGGDGEQHGYHYHGEGARKGASASKRGFRVRTGQAMGTQQLVDDGLERQGQRGGMRLGLGVDPVDHRSQTRTDSGWQTWRQVVTHAFLIAFTSDCFCCGRIYDLPVVFL